MNRKSDHDTRVCPVEIAGVLDHSLRRLIQNPRKILKPFIKTGMTVLDLGCGPGFFTIEMAKLLNSGGTVIAADLQEGMLKKVMRKISGTALEQRVKLHLCKKESIGMTDKVDFILAFYMVHEVPDAEHLMREMKSLLKPNGRILIIEPKFHVTKEKFAGLTEMIRRNGFTVKRGPKVFFSRSAILTLTY
jgi:ubiquinone/menaquinone biosynthesis C-methylase UbiE